MVSGLLTVQSEDIKRTGDSYTYDGVEVELLPETKERLERGDKFSLVILPLYVGSELVKYGEV